MTHIPWKVLSQTDVSPSRWLPVVKEEVELPTGTTVEYFKTTLPDVAMVVGITTNRELLLVKQYKHGIGQVCLELPAGRIEAGMTAAQTAVRELAEETGAVVAESALQPLGEVWTEPSKSTVRVFGYLATELQITQPQELEETEEIEVIPVPLSELKSLVTAGQIRASDTLALLWMAECAYPDTFNLQSHID